LEGDTYVPLSIFIISSSLFQDIYSPLSNLYPNRMFFHWSLLNYLSFTECSRAIGTLLFCSHIQFSKAYTAVCYINVVAELFVFNYPSSHSLS